VATYLLDTSVLIDVLAGKRRRAELLRWLLLQHHRLAYCSITVTEIYAGMRTGEEEQVRELLNGFCFFPVTWQIVRSAGLIKRAQARKGKALSLADATIAAVALAHDFALITDNVKDFPIPKLQVYPLPAT